MYEEIRAKKADFFAKSRTKNALHGDNYACGHGKENTLNHFSFTRTDPRQDSLVCRSRRSLSVIY